VNQNNDVNQQISAKNGKYTHVFLRYTLHYNVGLSFHGCYYATGN